MFLFIDIPDYTSERSFQDEKLTERMIPTPFPVKRFNINTHSLKANRKVYESYYAATDILTVNIKIVALKFEVKDIFINY